MVVTMPKTEIKFDGPAVRPSAMEIPVFEEVSPGRVILVGWYVRDRNIIGFKKAA